MPIQLNEVLTQLSRTPAMLRAWFSGLPECWLTTDEGPDTFSARDVLAHLIHGERTDWMARVRLILEAGEGTPFEPFDRGGFLAEARTWSVEDLLDEFTALRRANLQALEALQLQWSDLDRRGTHPALGSVTLGQLLATWTVHDLGHVAQAAWVMAKAYRVEVGPWEAYLPVLRR